MVKSALSNKAQKRLQKEAELLDSSWKLAANLYGLMWADRWESLREAIIIPRVPLVCLNNYTDKLYATKDMIVSSDESLSKFHSIHYYKAKSEEEFDQLERTGGMVELDHEWLPILTSLGLMEEDNVLEMFSNTSSTTMALLQLLKTIGFTATINQGTPDKYQKLKKTVYDTVSKLEEERLRLTGWDGIKFGASETALYDKVICDVPCSNERKLFNDEKLMKKWTDKATRQHAKKQLLWLISALASAKPGGTVLYVSRTISEYESDEVIEKALKKSRTQPNVVKLKFDQGQPTKFGWRFLPDQDHHIGPLYISKLSVSK